MSDAHLDGWTDERLRLRSSKNAKKIAIAQSLFTSIFSRHHATDPLVVVLPKQARAAE